MEESEDGERSKLPTCGRKSGIVPVQLPGCTLSRHHKNMIEWRELEFAKMIRFEKKIAQFGESGDEHLFERSSSSRRRQTVGWDIVVERPTMNYDRKRVWFSMRSRTITAESVRRHGMNETIKYWVTSLDMRAFMCQTSGWHQTVGDSNVVMQCVELSAFFISLYSHWHQIPRQEVGALAWYHGPCSSPPA